MTQTLRKIITEVQTTDHSATPNVIEFIADSDAIAAFICLVPLESYLEEGETKYRHIEDLTLVFGTVNYEIRTTSNPYYVDLQAPQDVHAPVDSTFRAPVTEVRATLVKDGGQAYGFDFYLVQLVQAVL